jgi:hypothetical protein
MKNIFLLLIISCSFLSAQKKEDEKLIGILYADSKITFDNALGTITLNPDSQVEGRKSPLLAGVLSFVVPGAGEFYSESYIKTAAFVAIEAAAITIGLIYDKKGNDQTNVFQNYANQNWSVNRYARWTVTNANTINTGVDPTLYNVFDNNGNVNWKELNRLESDLGGYYSHRLAYFGEQQYYEMIGKYQQFNPGWVEFGDDPNKPYTYGDPLVPQFHEYAVMRGKANDFYDVASKAVIVIVANHFISAIDAAWSASRYNKGLEVSAQLQKFDLGHYALYYPQLNLQYYF